MTDLNLLYRAEMERTAPIRSERAPAGRNGERLSRQSFQVRERGTGVEIFARTGASSTREEASGQFSALCDDAARRVASLTPRQKEIMNLVLAGHRSKTIAWRLGISQRTVENHRAAIMKKTGSKSLPMLACVGLAADWTNVNGRSDRPGRGAETILSA
jgi:DNA-binding CsgD family transcriptional regulator